MTAGISAQSVYVPKRVRRSAGVLSLLLVLLGGAPLILGAFGAPWLSGDEDWLYWSTTFDVLNNFIPIWAALIGLGLVLALARRRTSRIFFGIASALFFAALLPIGLELSRSPGSVEYGPGVDPGRSVRLIQFNALSANSDLDAALDLALEHDVDLIMVEEPLRFRTLEPYLKLLYPFKTPCPRDRCRAIIYSRLPPVEAEYHTLRGNWYPDKYTPGNGFIGVASMKIGGPDGEPFTAIATHFRWPFPPMPVLHQRDVFLDHIEEVDRTRAIVAGDFNLAPWTFEMRGFDEDIAPMRRMTRALFTFPAPFSSPGLPLPFSILPIDHVYAGSRWQMVSVERGPFAGSDHYPVIVELVMPRQADEGPAERLPSSGT